MSINLEEVIKHLSAPFPFCEIECKVQATTADKSKGLAVFYINSRAIQNRLDAVVGPFNWCNQYNLWQDKAQICGISIYDETRNEWVTKHDGAENTEYEPVKGGLSDSLKRAAVMWGIGRYLYDIEGIWVEIEQKGKSSLIKNSEKKKLSDHYHAFINKIRGGQKDFLKQSPQEMPESGNVLKGSVDYDFMVKSAAENGNSTCLKLVRKNGEELTAYIKKDSPGIKPGARIRNTKLEERETRFGKYYTLNQYDVAA